MLVIKYKDDSFTEMISRLYQLDNELEDNESISRTITFQITDDCPMACTYCYQCNKGHKMMSKETAKRGIDLLFEMYDRNDHPFINHKTQSIVLDFIGGEPLMNIEVIDYVCTYFMEECLKRNHPWIDKWRASMISNGALYFNPKVQEFLSKFRGFVSFGITLDGPKEIHDACRIYHDGRGNFDDAYKAYQHYRKYYYDHASTKVTLAPENLHDINKIVKFFVDDGVKLIHANCAFEPEWTLDHARLFYSELKKMADYLLELHDETTVSLFTEDVFEPISEDENGNYCGGTGAMLAFDPDGIAYPCLRYMPSSLGSDVEPLIVGDVNGIFNKPEHQQLKSCLDCITRRSQSTDECFYCPVAKGCAWCSAWNYQSTGTPNQRCTNICWMHKARSLANVYYWNKWYKINEEDKKMKMHLPKEDALQIISEEEYMMLLELAK